MKKRVLSLVLGLSLMLALLSACGGDSASVSKSESLPAEGSSAPSVAEPESTAGAGGSITIASSANWTKDIDQELADKFTDETGIKVEFQLTPDDQYYNVLKAKLSTGEGPDVLLTASGVGMYELLPDQNFLDLSNEPWAERQVDWATAGTSYNGQRVAMNLWSADGWALLYDPAKFEEAKVEGVPKTYEEFAAACDKLMGAGYTPLYSCGSAVWYQALWLDVISGTAAATDPDYLTKFNDNSLKFADVENYETGMTQLKEMVDKGYFGEDYMATTWEDSVENMVSGEYAMIMVYTAYPNELMEADPSCGADSWEMFPVPLADNDKFAMSSGGIVHAINKNSQNIDAAKAYLDFRARLDNVEAFYKARADLGPSAFSDYTGATTKAYDAVLANSSGNTPNLENNALFYNTTNVGSYFQELYMGSLSPAELLGAIDTERQNLFDVME